MTVITNPPLQRTQLTAWYPPKTLPPTWAVKVSVTGDLFASCPTTSKIMRDIRCGKCRKKLAEGLFSTLNIKCPRCGAFNQMSATRAQSERHGTPFPKGSHDQESQS
jgi:phage FluMu protein Com